MFLCPECFQAPVVYALKQPLDFRIIESKHAIMGKITNLLGEGVLLIDAEAVHGKTQKNDLGQA